MEELKKVLEEILNESLLEIRISNSKNQEVVSKIKIRPVLIKDILQFQASRFVGKQIFHKNFPKQEMKREIERIMTDECKQLEAETKSERIIVLISKKGKVTVKRKQVTGCTRCAESDLSHNRIKTSVLPEDQLIPFLQDLGVQTADGKIKKGMYDKFRQLNRYLEFVSDILPALKNIDKEKLTILDFGCGKSYLTFALYYYLHEMNQMPVRIIGLDLKKDVIEKCNVLSNKYGYEDLKFIHGDIAEFEGEEDKSPIQEVDMVVTLHACDTATDYALEKALAWNAKVIFSVPCCQHEINGQINNEILQPVLKYGLLKERISALITDGLRANILEANGYETQILEFIDLEQTPKNILIRAVKNDKTKSDGKYMKLIKELNLNPTLLDLLQRKA